MLLDTSQIQPLTCSAQIESPMRTSADTEPGSGLGKAGMERNASLPRFSWSWTVLPARISASPRSLNPNKREPRGRELHGVLPRPFLRRWRRCPRPVGGCRASAADDAAALPMIVTASMPASKVATTRPPGSGTGEQRAPRGRIPASRSCSCRLAIRQVLVATVQPQRPDGLARSASVRPSGEGHPDRRRQGELGQTAFSCRGEAELQAPGIETIHGGRRSLPARSRR